MNANQFRRLQVRALRPLLKLIRALFHSRGVPVTEPQIEEFAVALYRPMLAARARNYNAGLAYLQSQRLPSGIVIPRPREYPMKALVNTVTEVSRDLRIQDEPVTVANRHQPLVIKPAQLAIEGAASRVALEPARETVQEIGEDEEFESIGWARVLVGAYSCSFCAMLASRGPVYNSFETAQGRGGNPLDAYHKPYLNKNGKLVGGVCDCIAVIVTSFGTWEGRAAWEALEDLWEKSGGKKSNKAARNAFRRVWDAKVRAGETDQYLPDSLNPAA